jgi:hypothetical protein
MEKQGWSARRISTSNSLASPATVSQLFIHSAATSRNAPLPRTALFAIAAPCTALSDKFRCLGFGVYSSRG